MIEVQFEVVWVLEKGAGKISGPVGFLTNKDTGKVFPVGLSDPKAREAFKSPKHIQVMSKIIAQSTGTRGGDHRKHIEHFAAIHADEAKGKTPEEFAKFLEDKVREHTGTKAAFGEDVVASFKREGEKRGEKRAVGASSAFESGDSRRLTAPTHTAIGSSASDKKVVYRNGRVEFDYPFDREMNETLKRTFPGKVRFDGDRKKWHVPASKEVLPLLQDFAKRHGFHMSAATQASIAPTMGGQSGGAAAVPSAPSVAAPAATAPASSAPSAPTPTSGASGGYIPFAERMRIAKENTASPGIPKVMEGGAMGQGGVSLHPYQNSGINWMMEAKRGILGDEMGLGKTLQAITAASLMKEKGATDGAMMVVPSGVIHNWKQEIQKWAPGAKVVVVSGTPKKREEAYAEAAKGYDFLITSYSMVQREPEKLKAVNGPRVAKFADEAHRMKGSTSQVSQNFKDHLSEGPVIAMTGTPMPNKPDELYNLMSIVSPGTLGNFYEFKRKFAVTTPVWTGMKTVDKIIGYKNLADLRKQVEPYMRIKRRDDPDVRLALPDVTHITPALQMDDDQARVYKSYTKAAINDLREAVNAKDGDPSKMANALVSLTRLRQVAVTPELLDPSYKGGAPKVEEAVDRIAEHHANNPDKGAVVFSEFNGVFPILQRELKAQGYQDHEFGVIAGDVSQEARAKAQDDLNAGRLKVLFVATKAGGEGLNLQKNANMVVHMTTPWNPALLDQATARVHRQGQQSGVTVFRPQIEGGIDEKIERAHVYKRDLAQQVLGGGKAQESVDVPAGLDAAALLKILEGGEK